MTQKFLIKSIRLINNYLFSFTFILVKIIPLPINPTFLRGIGLQHTKKQIRPTPTSFPMSGSSNTNITQRSLKNWHFSHFVKTWMSYAHFIFAADKTCCENVAILHRPSEYVEMLPPNLVEIV